MKNEFNYMPSSELDSRLEKVIESHRAEVSKESSTPVAETESGLQSFVQRQTIAEEIASIDRSKVASIDLHAEIAKDQIDGIIEEKTSRFDSFLEAAKTASEEITKVDPVKTAQELIHQGVDPQEAARRALA